MVDSDIIQVENLDSGCIKEDPSLTIREFIGKVKSTRKIPVMILNETNKCYTFKRGCIIGKGKESTICTIQHPSDDNEQLLEKDFQNLHVPTEHRVRVLTMLKRNNDLFASEDTELGHTDTVTMKIEMAAIPQ